MNSSSSAIELHSGQKVAKFCPLTELVSGATHLPSNQAAVNPNLSRGDKEKLLQTLLEFSDIFEDQLGH